MKLIITCEHGGNIIPEKYGSLFVEAQENLQSHLGFDAGTYNLLMYLSPLADFSKATQISRLLIETNRSLHHQKLFSDFTKKLNQEQKDEIINQFYLPYRTVIENKIQLWIAEGECVFHLSLHSFTPILNKKKRLADIGILYDSKITSEKKLARTFKATLQEFQPSYKIRFNYPYLGSADGFTTYLRKKNTENYIGIELEINQKYVQEDSFPLAMKKSIKKVIEKIS